MLPVITIGEVYFGIKITNVKLLTDILLNNLLRPLKVLSLGSDRSWLNRTKFCEICFVELAKSLIHEFSSALSQLAIS